MKTRTLEKFYIYALLLIFGGIIFHAPLSVGLGVVFPDYSLLIKSWKEIVMLGLVPLAWFFVTRRRMWRQLLEDWVVRLVLAYSTLHIVLIPIFYQGWKSTAAGLAIDLRYILFFSLVYIGLKIAPRYRSCVLITAVAGAVVVIGFAVLQLFLPVDILSHIGYSKETIAPYLTVDKNPDYIRVNSTLRGPNPLGAYATMVLALLTAFLARHKFSFRDKRLAVGLYVFGLCSVIALWISYSRSALGAAVISVLLVLVATILRKPSKQTLLVLGSAIVLLVAALIIGRDSSFVSNTLLHENPDGGSPISSNDGHVSSVSSALSDLVQQPFGSGVGSTGSASLFGDKPLIVENQYLFVGHETGWLGLGLFVALYGLILIRIWRTKQAGWVALGVGASGVGLGLIGLLLPVWVDDTVAIIWWGLAALVLAGGKRSGK